MMNIPAAYKKPEGNFCLSEQIKSKDNRQIPSFQVVRPKPEPEPDSRRRQHVPPEMSEQNLYSFIHLVVCLTTGPKPLPKRALHIVRSRASSFKREYPLLSLRSSSSFLHLLPCLPVTSIPPCIFPSVTRCRRQFLRRM